ncbi:MAG: hypothetical protein ACLVLH_10100 [Eisenbergiella massiliensis]
MQNLGAILRKPDTEVWSGFERWCPSDGLVTERYSDGTPYSSWFTYNMWSAANILRP